MMRNRPPFVRALAAALPLLLAACGDTASDSTSNPADASGDERRYISIGTAPTGGAFFPVGGALAEVVESRIDGWQVTAEATKGSQENIRRLVQGDLELALSNAAITYFAVRGESGWQRPHDVRAVMTLAPNVALFLTPRGTGIASIADLAGKRVVIGPAGAGFEMFVRPIVEAHGVGWDQLTVLNNTQSAAVDMLTDGSADAAFLGGAVPTASITQAATSMDLLLVPFDPAARQRLIDEYPFFHPATIPAGTYRGQEAAMEVLNVGSMHLIAGADTDEDLVYRVTKELWEGRDDVAARHPAGRAIQPAVVVRDTGTPFHPGAERFYREIGIWPDDDAAPTPADAGAADAGATDAEAADAADAAPPAAG